MQFIPSSIKLVSNLRRWSDTVADHMLQESLDAEILLNFAGESPLGVCMVNHNISLRPLLHHLNNIIVTDQHTSGGHA